MALAAQSRRPTLLPSGASGTFTLVGLMILVGAGGPTRLVHPRARVRDRGHRITWFERDAMFELNGALTLEEALVVADSVEG